MLEIDFDTSEIDHVIEATETFLTERGILDSSLERVGKHLHITAEDKDSERQFVKVAWTPEGIRGLETGVEFADFVKKQTQDNQPLRLPESSFFSRGNVAFGVYEWIDFDGYGEEYPVETVMRLDKNHFEAMFQTLLFLDGFKQNNLSMYFIGDSGRHNENAVTKRLETHLQNAQNNELLSDEFCGRVRDVWGELPFEQSFQHYDFAPWNMGRDKDGDFVLLDAEQARWGMRCYDIAYFYLQTTLRAQEPEIAKRFLRFMIKRFNEEKREFAIRKYIFTPLTHSAVVSINEYSESGQEERVEKAKELLEIILEQNIDELV